MSTGNPNPIPVVLDVDTGVDDALALLLAVRSPRLEVLAITCVAGNTPVDGVVANTLKVLDAAGAPDLPVGRGADRPLLGEPPQVRLTHGADGMADLGLPDSPRSPAPVHAVELLRQTLAAAARPVTVVTLAPLTNLALLLRMYPDAGANIERIVLMGGSAAAGGNHTATAEFNVGRDPEAAAIVLTAGIPTTMYCLDVFYDVAVEPADVHRLSGSAEPGARLAGRLLQHRLHQHGEARLGDAGAVAVVIDPAGLRTDQRRVLVELTGQLSRGQTVVDRRDWGPDLELSPFTADEIDVATSVDGERYAELFLETVDG